MLVGLLADFADAEAVVGNAANAATLLRESARLRAAMAAFEGCELKRGARNLVF